MPTVPELREIAEANEIDIPSDFLKADIEAALEEAGIDFESNGDEESTEEDIPEFPSGVDDGVIAETRAKLALAEAEPDDDDDDESEEENAEG